jgi:catechol 2,3-dioxygenase-like lactoylglutathione lyase family enzyme
MLPARTEHPMLNHVATTIPVCDLDRSLSFYCDVLGFRLVHRIENQLVYLERSQSLIAVAPVQGMSKNPPALHIGIVVSDLQKSRVELESQGIAFLGENVDVRGAKIAFFNDPDGTPMYLFQLAS